jgi:hypothetical protein
MSFASAMPPMIKYTLLLVSLFIFGGCKSKVDKAFDVCMAQITEASSAAVGKDQAKTEQEKAFAETAGAMFMTMGASTCNAIRTQCKADAKGAACLEQLGLYQ